MQYKNRGPPKRSTEMLQTGSYLFQNKERIFIVFYIVSYIFAPFLNNSVSLCF